MLQNSLHTEQNVTVYIFYLVKWYLESYYKFSRFLVKFWRLLCYLSNSSVGKIRINIMIWFTLLFNKLYKLYKL